MQRAHRLRNGHAGVKAVYLQEVNVWGVEAREGGVDGVEDARAGEAVLVDVVTGVA